MARSSNSYSGSNSARQIQKQWNTYKANKAYKNQLNKAEKRQPIYTDAYKGYKDAVVSQLENGNDFSFDAASNPVYQAYAQDYRLLGNIAADQSAANIEGLSGGYGTTYSGNVAQQGLDNYLANEKAIIPSLYQQELQNYQQDRSNLINRANLYNQLESQDFAQFQDKLARWNANREYAYNKFMTDYQQSARTHSTESGSETSTQTKSGTSYTPSSGRSSTRGKYTKLTGDALKTRKGAMAYLADNGLDASNVMSKEQFQAENARRRWNSYAEDKKALDKDYEDYLLNYIRQAQGYEDKDWFSKTQKKLNKNIRDYYK